MVTYARRRLNSKLVAASRDCILRQQDQALLSGWLTLANFSGDLHAPDLAYTPQLRERFAKLAHVILFHIDYPGEEIWMPEDERC